MKQYGYFQAIYLSFFSKALYRDVARNWGIGTLAYLLLVIFIFSVLSILIMQPLLSAGIHRFANDIAPQLPHMVIKDGVLETDEAKPYFIYQPSDHQLIAVIDTSGNYRPETATPAPTVVIQKNSIVYLDARGKTTEYTYPATLNMEIKPIEIKESLVSGAGWLWTVLLPFSILAAFVYRLIQAIIYAVFGKIFSLMSDARLSYAQNYKLSLVAITPAMFLATLLSMFGISFPYQYPLYFLITLGYLLFAVRANKN